MILEIDASEIEPKAVNQGGKLYVQRTNTEALCKISPGDAIPDMPSRFQRPKYCVVNVKSLI